MYNSLISAQQLQTLQASGQPVMVFDCSFELTQSDAGDQQYAQVHIPGAIRADLNQHLSAAKTASDAASGGRHPLPSRDTFAAWLSSVGFNNDMQAVVYDRQGANYCGRLWWLMKWVGHDAVALLDGGWQAWLGTGGATQSGPQRAPAVTSNFQLAPARTTLITTDILAQRLGRPTQILIDARATPRFRGEVEPLDPVPGHIPGALNRPFYLNIGPDGKFKPATELRAEFDALLAGRDPASVVHHCGSGVSALPNLIAMALAGLGPTALYAGSWSEWCRDPKRPMALG